MVRRVFIYGKFMTEEEASPSPLAPFLKALTFTGTLSEMSGSELSTEAIEILREPSVLELIGKVYVLTSARNYQPVTPLGVRNFTWYTNYQDAVTKQKKFYFKAKDGDLWLVPWMRLESDETGSYIAVALKHA